MDSEKCLTISQLASRLCVGRGKILAWIRLGELSATDVSLVPGGRPRWVVTEEALRKFLKRRASTPDRQATRGRVRLKQMDFYPE